MKNKETEGHSLPFFFSLARMPPGLILPLGVSQSDGPFHQLPKILRPECDLWFDFEVRVHYIVEITLITLKGRC